MGIVEALNTLQPLVLREGDDCELDALSTIRAALVVVQKFAEALKPSHNIGSPKLLDEMEQFAVMCDRAGNWKDARCVRSWVKQLRAGACERCVQCFLLKIIGGCYDVMQTV